MQTSKLIMLRENAEVVFSMTDSRLFRGYTKSNTISNMLGQDQTKHMVFTLDSSHDMQPVKYSEVSLGMVLHDHVICTRSECTTCIV